MNSAIYERLLNFSQYTQILLRFITKKEAPKGASFCTFIELIHRMYPKV